MQMGLREQRAATKAAASIGCLKAAARPASRMPASPASDISTQSAELACVQPQRMRSKRNWSPKAMQFQHALISWFERLWLTHGTMRRNVTRMVSSQVHTWQLFPDVGYGSS